MFCHVIQHLSKLIFLLPEPIFFLCFKWLNIFTIIIIYEGLIIMKYCQLKPWSICGCNATEKDTKVISLHKLRARITYVSFIPSQDQWNVKATYKKYYPHTVMQENLCGWVLCAVCARKINRFEWAGASFFPVWGDWHQSELWSSM